MRSCRQACFGCPQKQWKRNLMCAARGELSGERKFGRGPPQYCEQSAPEMIEEKHDRSKLPMLMRTPWKNCIHNTFASALVAFAKFYRPDSTIGWNR
jgi:hypothetical protein